MSKDIEKIAPLKDKMILANIEECSLKFNLKVGVEKSIVNAPRIADHGSAF
jgi:hypothetical protein